MKGLKKLALVSAISLASFGAQAELQAMNDTAMGDVTGQAGVTIELQTKVSIGEFRYTDEGDLAVSGIFIGGGAVERDANNNVTGVSGLLDNLLVDIDINANGDAVIDVHSTDNLPIDYAVGIQGVSLRAAGVNAGTANAGNSTLLASNIGIVGQLGALNITVATATDTLTATVGFNITDLDADVDFLGIGVRDMKLMGSQFFEQVAAAGQPTDAAGLFANAQVTVSKGTGAITGKEGLKLGIATFAADVHIGAVEMGGVSIGSIAMDNLVISDTEMLIYGH